MSRRIKTLREAPSQIWRKQETAAKKGSHTPREADNRKHLGEANLTKKESIRSQMAPTHNNSDIRTLDVVVTNNLV